MLARPGRFVWEMLQTFWAVDRTVGQVVGGSRFHVPVGNPAAVFQADTT